MPLQSMIYIIEDFLERNSYYTEKEILYTTAKSGKISWNRTVKQLQLTVSESGIAFLGLIVRKNHFFILKNSKSVIQCSCSGKQEII